MFRKLMSKVVTITCSGAALTAVMVGQPAHAEHVVTEYEAGKLTLAALTAAPPARIVHHVSHRRSIRGHGAHVVLAAHHGRSARSMVHTVAYHSHATSHKTGKRRHHT